jgi:hypothetical protein
MLEVTIYDNDGRPKAKFSEDNDTDVDFVSLVSNETYGPPALVAPNRNGQGPRANVGDRVLYINTALVPIFQIERTSD